MDRRPAAPLFALLLGGMTLFAACDSSDPIDAEPADVAGTYTFEQLQFVPDNPSLPMIDLRADTLLPATTSLRLTSGGDYVLSYQFKGGLERVLTGEFRVTRDQVRLSGRNSEAGQYRQLLLEPDFNLDRSDTDPNVLTATVSRTVNADPFPDYYPGIGSVQGEVRLRLVRT